MQALPLITRSLCPLKKTSPFLKIIVPPLNLSAIPELHFTCQHEV